MKSQQPRVPPRQLGQLSPDGGAAAGGVPLALAQLVSQSRGPAALCWAGGASCAGGCVCGPRLLQQGWPWDKARGSSTALARWSRPRASSGQVSCPPACVLPGEARQGPRHRQVTEGPCVSSLPFRTASRLRSQAPRRVAAGHQGSSRRLVKSRR